MKIEIEHNMNFSYELNSCATPLIFYYYQVQAETLNATFV